MVKTKVYLIGAGPGRADLITVRGLNALQEAEVVIYDYLADKGLAERAREDAKLICADELGKKRYQDGFSSAQAKINNLMIKYAKQGRKVIRLKNGDAAIFGRLSQETEALRKHKIDYEIIPGVTAGSAAAAYSGIPLTDRRFSSSVVFMTGHEDSNKKASLLNWQSIAAQKTIVIYMGVGDFSQIVDKLLKLGKAKNTPVVVISQVGGVGQKRARGNLRNIVAKIKQAKILAPAIIIIGQVAALDWPKKKKRILFTGLSAERFFLKEDYVHFPLIEIEPLEDYDNFDQQVKTIGQFDWLVFASRYGVECFFKRLLALGIDNRILQGIKIAAIGNSTKNRLRDFCILADLVPANESAKGLLAEFRKIDLKGKKIFLPRSDLADKGLEQGFEKLGAEVRTLPAYRNIRPKGLPDIDLTQFDEIMFTSPSTVRNFKKRYKKVPKGVKVRWIGERTKKEVKCKLKI